MTENYIREGCPITMERWSEEKTPALGKDRVVLADWIEFKDADKKTILKVSFSYWKQLSPEVRDALVERMREYYG